MFYKCSYRYIIICTGTTPKGQCIYVDDTSWVKFGDCSSKRRHVCTSDGNKTNIKNVLDWYFLKYIYTCSFSYAYMHTFNILALTAGACSSKFYQLDGKCINYFLDAGERTNALADSFCKVNGGDLAYDLNSDNNFNRGKKYCFYT